jgi:hypothetical protein
LNDVVAGGFEPPDVVVAAGPGFVVEMVNLAASVWRTGGGTPQLVQTRDRSVFFGSGRDRLTDPRVLYDVKSGRWFASISDVDSKEVLLAVSSGVDPTGTWTVARFDASGCADQPRLGIADDIVVLSADLFEDCDARGARALGSEIWTVNKAQLLAGSTGPDFALFGPTNAYSSVAPVQSLSPTATEYAVSVDDRVSRVAHLLAVDGVPPAPVTVREIATPVISLLARPPSAAQPQTGGLRPSIATNDQRVLDSVWENGRLWFSANARCVPAGDAIIRTCARVVELVTPTGAVAWDKDIGFAGVHVFYPAVRPDADGNLVIVAGESGLNVLPELIALGRTPDGALTDPVVVAQSAGVYRGDRYGDYFGAARDPLDPRTVWVGGEAGTDVPSGSGWATTVASVVVTPVGATPPAVAGTAPPGVRAIALVVHAGDPIRLAYRALDDGTRVRTIVVVQNAKKAVVYRGSTARKTLHAEERYSMLWPAKKARGTFTFCVNTVSTTGMQSPASCARVTIR